MLLPQEIIRHKRDKQVLPTEEIRAFIAGITENTVSEAQIAAFTMAVFLNGMDRQESVDLTLRLKELGFLPGESVRVLHRGFPGGDPLAVRIGNATFALRRHEAALVAVGDD